MRFSLSATNLLKIMLVLGMCQSFAFYNNNKLASLSRNRPTRALNDAETEYSVKLKAEAAAPFRLFRTFVYGALGAAAGLGTLTTVPQLVKQLSEHSDITTTLTNLAVNTGGLHAAGFLISREASAGNKQRRSLLSKQAITDNMLNAAQIRSREAQLQKLPVEIQVSEINENVTRIVSLGDLLKQGKQHVIIVAGNDAYVRDAIIAARLVDGSQFSSNGITIIPFVNDETKLNDRTSDSNKGFGMKKSPIMSEPFFAKPQQDYVWQSILREEAEVAALQQQRTVSSLWEQGIVLAMNRNETVVRRGLGIPDWTKLVQLLSQTRT